ncbi:MAG: hypothetical protein RL331_1866 [Bacteroidota bacterium]|jgi:hypothetical protein
MDTKARHYSSLKQTLPQQAEGKTHLTKELMKGNKVPARKLNKLHPNGQRSVLLVR